MILARHFMESFKQDHIDFHRSDIQQLSSLTNSIQMAENTFVQRITSEKMKVIMTDYTFQLLLAFLQDKDFIDLIKILNERINVSGFTIFNLKVNYF